MPTVKAALDFGLVLEGPFKGNPLPTRRKCGVVMRCIDRTRWGKPLRDTRHRAPLKPVLG